MFKNLLLSLLFVAPVAKAEWIEVDRDKETIFYMDPERIISTYDSLKYAETWVKQVIHTDVTKDGLAVGDYQLTKFNFKCNTNEFGIAAMYSYSKGKLINSDVARSVAFSPAIPDSRGEFVTYIVCKSLYDKES